MWSPPQFSGKYRVRKSQDKLKRPPTNPSIRPNLWRPRGSCAETPDPDAPCENETPRVLLHSMSGKQLAIDWTSPETAPEIALAFSTSPSPEPEPLAKFIASDADLPTFFFEEKTP